MFKQGMTTKGNCNCRIKRSHYHVSCNSFCKASGTRNGTYRLNQHEENDKKKKGIALKTSSSIQEESDKEDLNEIEEDDNFSLFIKRFNKFLRKKRKSKKNKLQSKEKRRRQRKLASLGKITIWIHLKTQKMKL